MRHAGDRRRRLAAKLDLSALQPHQQAGRLVLAVCPRNGQRKARSPAAVCDGNVPRSGGRIRRADGIQRTPALLHREGRQGHVAAAVPYVLQPIGPAAVQELRPAGGEAKLRNRGD